MMSAAAAGQYYRTSAAAAAQMRSVYNPAGIYLSIKLTIYLIFYFYEFLSMYL